MYQFDTLHVWHSLTGAGWVLQGSVHSECQESAQIGVLLVSIYGVQGQSVPFVPNSTYPFSCNPA